VPFREFCPVGSVDERNMSKLRGVGTEGTIKQRLSKRVRQVIVTADDMGYPHIDVVDDD